LRPGLGFVSKGRRERSRQPPVNARRYRREILLMEPHGVGQPGEPGEPGETGLRPDGTVPPWQPMPPCHRCGAAFAAHLDGRCPQIGATQPVTAQQWAAGVQGSGQPFAPWVPPLGGPPPMPALAGPRPSWGSWPRRHRLLTGAIMLVVLLISIGTVREVSLATSQPAQANGNATACTDFWRMAAVGDYGGGLLAGWQGLQAAAPGITSPALSTPVRAFVADLQSGDTVDAGTESIAVATACTALGYGNPG
jgi:hypothetical protein